MSENFEEAIDFVSFVSVRMKIGLQKFVSIVVLEK